MASSRFHTKSDFVSEVTSPSGSLSESADSSVGVEDCSTKTVREKNSDTIYYAHKRNF